MKINDKKKLIKNLYLYRSFIFHSVKFETTSKDKDIKLIVDALNIKKRYDRIYFVIDKVCDQIDDYYKGENICGFKNNKCICHREKKKNYLNGCCRKCMYQSTDGCTTKNYACKMFNCSYVKNNYKTITKDQLLLLKVLNPVERFNLKYKYFESISEVSHELYWGTIYSVIRSIIRFIKVAFGS